MKKYIALFLLMATIIVACSKVPITGRRQLNLLPEGELMAMSNTSYNDFLKDHKVLKKGAQADMVKRAGNRIADAVTRYLKKHGQSKRVKDFKWEFNLVDDKQVNAWAMPGGKVVVYTGILDVAQSENGLAVVMGHEVAHAIARHGNERMSQQLGAQLGGVALGVALSKKSKETQDVFNQAYGMGAAYGLMLPFSRKHESESDEMGLVFMAMAGYDPREAPKFWQRMAAKSEGAPPEFMSTHPSHNTRVKQLNEFMPEAMKHYEKSDKVSNKGTSSGTKSNKPKSTKPRRTTPKKTKTNKPTKSKDKVKRQEGGIRRGGGN